MKHFLPSIQSKSSRVNPNKTWTILRSSISARLLAKTVTTRGHTSSVVLTHGRPLGVELLWARRHPHPHERLLGPPALGGTLVLVGPWYWWAPALGGHLLLVGPALGGPLLLVGPCSWWALFLVGPCSWWALFLVGPCSWWALFLVGPCSW